MRKIYEASLPCETGDRVLLIEAYAAALSFFALFVPFRLGVNVPIFVTLVYIVAFRYQKRTNAPVSRGSISLFLTVMIATLPFVLYDDSPFRTLHFFVLICALFFQLFTMFSCRIYPRLSENWVFDLANAALIAPLANMDAFWRILDGTFRTNRMRTLYRVTVGVAAALPLVIILIFKLSSLDEAFARFYTQADSQALRRTFIAAAGLVAAAPVAAIIYGFLYGIRHRRATALITKRGSDGFHVLPPEPIIGAMGLICAVQILYIIFQIEYFIPDFVGFVPGNYTYAEYARRDFLELCGVSVLNLLIISAARVFVRYKKESSRRMIHILTITLCVCSVLMIAVALFKMFLYMQSFGLTANRIITTWFMLGLCLVFIFTLIQCFRPGFKAVRAVTVTAIVMFLMLCFADCDNLAVGYNKDAYLAGRLDGFDIEMLYFSSDSVIPVVIDLYENSDGEVREGALALLENYGSNYENSGADWRSFNLTRLDARNKYIKWRDSFSADRP